MCRPFEAFPNALYAIILCWGVNLVIGFFGIFYFFSQQPPPVFLEQEQAAGQPIHLAPFFFALITYPKARAKIVSITNIIIKSVI